MLVPFNIKASRDKEIEVLVEHVAKQFNITDPLDLADLRTAIFSKVDTAQPLISYTKLPAASSANFRSAVRAAYIDLSAYFIQLRDIERALRRAEAISRKTFDAFDAKRKAIAGLIQPEDTDLVHREIFEVESAGGYYSGVHVHNGKLRLRMEDVNPPYQLTSAEAYVYPVPNTAERIIQSTTGSITSILDTGIGSKIWSIDLFTPTKPELYWTQSISGSHMSEGANILYQGILIDIRITLSKAVSLNYIAAKFLTPTRLIRAYIDVSSEGEPSVWEPLLTSTGQFVKTEAYARSLEVFNFQARENSNQVRLILNVNKPETSVEESFILDKMYSRKEVFQGVATDNPNFAQQVLLPESFLYSFGVYNIKLRDRQPIFRHGVFISDSYPTTLGAVIGTELRTTDSQHVSGAQIYTIKFGNKSEMAILPKGASLDVEELVDTDAQGHAILSFPASKSVTSVGHRFTAITYAGAVIGPVFSVTKTDGTPVLNGKDIAVSYQTGPYSRYAFMDSTFTNFATAYAADPAGQCTIFTRVDPAFWDATPRISSYEAVPVASYYINETFFGQSLIELDQVPWVDMTGASPIILTILPEIGADAFSSETHPNLLVDRTNYYNRRIQPLLENYDAVHHFEYFIRGNQIFLNSGQYYQLQVSYPVKTEGVRVQIDQQAKGNLSPWVDDYTLSLIIQKD